MKISKNRHLLHLRRRNCCIFIYRLVIVGDTVIGVGLNQCFIQKLFLFIGHIRNQQGEENHKLLNLIGQHRTEFHIVHRIDELHFGSNRVSDLHNVDTVRRTGSNTDELTTHSITSTSELVSLNRCQDEALDAAHSHTQSQELKRKGFACATGADKVQVRVFVLLGIEQIHDTKRVIVTVDTKQDARIIRKLIACEHIG